MNNFFSTEDKVKEEMKRSFQENFQGLGFERNENDFEFAKDFAKSFGVRQDFNSFQNLSNDLNPINQNNEDDYWGPKKESFKTENNEFSKEEKKFDDLQDLEDEFYDKVQKANHQEMSRLFKFYFPKFKELLNRKFGNNPLAKEHMQNTYLLICYNKSAGIKNTSVENFIEYLDEDLKIQYKKLKDSFANIMQI